MTECARRESKERRPWSVYRHALLACFDSPRRLQIIPLQPKLYYILLTFIKLYSAHRDLALPDSQSLPMFHCHPTPRKSQSLPMSRYDPDSAHSPYLPMFQRDQESAILSLYQMFARPHPGKLSFYHCFRLSCRDAQSRIALSTLTEDL